MITLHDFLAGSGGHLHGSARAQSFSGFCYDSRLAQPGQLFLAVRSERADGHDYIGQACQAGVSGVLCQDPANAAGQDVTVVVVPDTRQAIQGYARYVLAHGGVEVVGITGSVGKTTAKEAIAAVLAAAGPVFRNRANYNGLYGLPIALGELAGEHVAVLEMAADHFGEMRRLCEIAPPRTAVVTAVAPAHVETFGSLDAIAREKAELVEALPADGLAVLNADDERVMGMAARTAARVVTFGIRDGRAHGRLDAGRPTDVVASDLLVTRAGVRFTAHAAGGQVQVQLPLLGRHQVYAALAAIAVGLAYGVSPEVIAARLEGLAPLPGRLMPLAGARGSLLLDDSYGASPAAVQAALDTLQAVEGRQKIAVLGDMVELGELETEGHQAVGKRAAEVLELLVTKGARARIIGEAARAAGMPGERVVSTYTSDDAVRAVLDRLGPGDVVLVKGSLAMRMEQVAAALLADPERATEVLVRQDAAWQQIVAIRPDRPTWLEIDLGAIAHNVRRLKAMAGDAGLMISLKADAYGHGAVQVAQTSLLNGATWLGVACFSEGAALRRAGIEAPILILGYTPAWQARDAVRYGLTATVFDLDVAAALSRAALALDRRARVHVKVDTGMSRLGVFPQEVMGLVRGMAALPGLELEGIFTHLSVADGAGEFERAYTASQLAAFDGVLRELGEAGYHIPLVHAENSAALLAGARGRGGQDGAAERSGGAWAASGSHRTLVRSGIAVYGLDPSPDVRCPADFRPALAWKTQVAQVKEHPAGTYVGYGATYRTGGAERIAVVPVGYADGFRRAPHHWGEVLVRGRRAPIVGRVCMDQTMISVSGIPGVRQGDEVVLIGKQGEDCITVEEVAARLGTINYEVVSAILARVPRETFA